MNVLGHPHIAWRVFEGFSKESIAGSWLPDLVPFVPDSVFEFEEIHEGGEKLLRFLDQNYPAQRGLALGMLSHGVTYGADKFSKMMEGKYESKRGEVTQRIMNSSPNLSYEAANVHRFHNFLWWGVDVQIMRNETEFMKQMKTQISQIDKREIANRLAECFQKPEAEVNRMVHFLLDPVTSDNISTVKGLANIWQAAAAGLPERDQVDIAKTAETFEYCASLVKNDWRDTVDLVANEVKNNLNKFI